MKFQYLLAAVLLVWPHVLIGQESSSPHSDCLALADYDRIAIGGESDPITTIRLVNELLKLGKAEEIAKCLLDDSSLSGKIVPIILPVLFPEELQDASTLPPSCDFAESIEGKFRWKNYYHSSIVMEDFPFYLYGIVGNAHDWDFADSLHWASQNGIPRKEALAPPNDLVQLTDRLTLDETLKEFVSDSRFPHSFDYTVAAIRKQVVRSLMEMPGTRSALSENFHATAWQRFKEVSYATRQFIIWDPDELQYIFDR